MIGLLLNERIVRANSAEIVGARTNWWVLATNAGNSTNWANANNNGNANNNNCSNTNIGLPV